MQWLVVITLSCNLAELGGSLKGEDLHTVDYLPHPINEDTSDEELMYFKDGSVIFVFSRDERPGTLRRWRR